MTGQEAIEAKCSECIVDRLEDGTLRQQVKACDIQSSALHPYCPMPYKPRNQLVQSDCQIIRDAVRVGPGSTNRLRIKP
jgi:hypothetical protein